MDRELIDKILDQSYVRLAISWWTNPPLPRILSTYTVMGDIDFKDGKASFTIENTGARAEIDVSHIERIFAIERK